MSNSATARTYLPECESIRGWAILLVLFFHANILWFMGGKQELPGFFYGFILAGDTGVILFFVLSGFLLSLPFIKYQNINIQSFYKNRALRILPLYILVISVGAIYHQDFIAFIKALLFWDIRVSTLPPFGSVGWSLMVEVQFYLLMPLFFACWNSTRFRPLLIPLLLFLAVTYLDISGRWDVLAFDWSLGLNQKNTIFARWPSFLAGMLLAFVYLRYGQRLKELGTGLDHRIPMVGEGLLIAQVIILGLLLHKVATMTQVIAYVYFFDRYLYESLIYAGIIATVLFFPLRIKPLIINAVFHFFGKISYSLYLLHYVVLLVAPEYLPKLIPGLPLTASLFITLLLTVLISWGCYEWVEKPFLQRKVKIV